MIEWLNNLIYIFLIYIFFNIYTLILLICYL